MIHELEQKNKQIQLDLDIAKDNLAATRESVVSASRCMSYFAESQYSRTRKGTEAGMQAMLESPEVRLLRPSISQLDYEKLSNRGMSPFPLNNDFKETDSQQNVSNIDIDMKYEEQRQGDISYQQQSFVHSQLNQTYDN